MAWYWVALILFGSALGLIMLGIPVAIGFFITNVLAAMLFMGGGVGIQQIINNGFGAMTNFALVPIPMFLFMGELFYHTGLATRCFNAADKLLGNIRGRLAYVTLIGGTAYAGPAGSSLGARAPPGRLLGPAKMKPGATQHLSPAPLTGAGGVRVLTPPAALPARHGHGLPRHPGLRHLCPGPGLHRRLERAHELGDRLRRHADRHVADHDRRDHLPRQLHGPLVENAADRADLFPAGEDPGLRSHLVRPDHAARLRDRLHQAPLRSAALRHAGGLAPGYHQRGNLLCGE